MSKDFSSSSNINNNNKVSLAINKKQFYADIALHGKVTRKLLNNIFLDLMEHPDFQHDINACYDYTQAYAGLEMVEIEEHAEFVAQYRDKRGMSYKLALISNDDLTAALLNIYKLMLASTSVEVEVFNQRQAAIDWITSVD